MMKEQIKISAADGYSLSVTSFSPRRFNGRVILINSATGVRQHYYEDFATWLSNFGYKVFTYDYRGIGGSKPHSLKGFKASMHEWGTLDYHSVLKYLFSAYTDAQFIVIGHSIGGQIIGMTPLSQNVDLFVHVGAQTPYWRNFNREFAPSKLFAFWYVTIPLLTKIFGYFPAKMLGLFEDLPKGVALQWARWAKSKNYIFDELPELKKHFADLHQPALMVSAEDDPYAPRTSVEELIRYYKHIKWTHWHIKPDEILQDEVGHFGFFRKKMSSALWPEIERWISKPFESKENKAA